jgi:transposase
VAKADIVAPAMLRLDGRETKSNAYSRSNRRYVDLEARVRKDHPLRTIRQLVNETLGIIMERDFAALYAGIGRPSIAPEKLLRAMLVQAFYSVRSERQLMERLEFDPLVRWPRGR